MVGGGERKGDGVKAFIMALGSQSFYLFVRIRALCALVASLLFICAGSPAQVGVCMIHASSLLHMP